MTTFLIVVTRIFDELANVVAEPCDELWQRLILELTGRDEPPALRRLPFDLSTGGVAAIVFALEFVHRSGLDSLCLVAARYLRRRRVCPRRRRLTGWRGCAGGSGVRG